MEGFLSHFWGTPQSSSSCPWGCSKRMFHPKPSRYRVSPSKSVGRHLHHGFFFCSRCHWKLGLLTPQTPRERFEVALRCVALPSPHDTYQDLPWQLLQRSKESMRTCLKSFHTALPSGKLTLLLKMAIEIVELPIKMVIFHSYVSLPEGIFEVYLFNADLHWLSASQWEHGSS